jgi:hypothetical protein
MCEGYRKRTGKVKASKAEKVAKSVKLPASAAKLQNVPR